jgi:acetylornithine deacetylase/succinyl-diaminopimelate desuccinylase-like protein
VSGDPARRGEVRRAAAWVAEFLRGFGCRVEVLETPGHPVVYGEWTGAPGRPTLLTYGHYDVQPEDPVDRWTSPPFEPAVREGAIYARGAADDKGQVFIHLKAAEAWLRAERRLPVNLKFLIEGEEEVGSPNLELFVAAEAGRLKADAVVISDTAMLAKGVPGLCVGLRGIVYCQVDLQGPATDLHSGVFGGSVANPANVLCRLLARLTDERGRVTIPGFYDDVRPLAPAERAAFAALPFDEAAYREALGVPALDGEVGFSIFTGSGGATTPIADTTGAFGGVDNPSINAGGTVAFFGGLDDGRTGIFIGGGGPITTIADSSEFGSVGIYPSINTAGLVAFRGCPASGCGIFTGPDPVADKVIQSGDPLFGSTVTDLQFPLVALNDH